MAGQVLADDLRQKATREAKIGSTKLEKFTPPKATGTASDWQPGGSGYESWQNHLRSQGKPTAKDFAPGGSHHEKYRAAIHNSYIMDQCGYGRPRPEPPKPLSAEELAERQRAKLPISKDKELADSAHRSSQGEPPVGAPVDLEKLAMSVMGAPAPRTQLALATPGDSEAPGSTFGVYVSQAAPKSPPGKALESSWTCLNGHVQPEAPGVIFCAECGTTRSACKILQQAYTLSRG